MTSARSETIKYAGDKTSQQYKDQMKVDFQIEGADSIVPNSVRGQRTPFGVVSRRAESYTQLSRAIDAIDNGPTTSNAPPLDVRRASADLVESCRKRLVELDIESEKQGYNAKNQEEREAIFALLEDVKIANAREKNWQWAGDFTASLSRQVYEGLAWAYANKWTLLTCGVIAGVTAAFAVPALLMLGPIGWGVLAFAALSFLGYLFYKVGSAISTAYNEANKKALNEKMEAGNAILGAAQETAKGELENARKTHAEAKEASKIAEEKYTELSEGLQAFREQRESKINELNDKIQISNEFITNLGGDIITLNEQLAGFKKIQEGEELSEDDQQRLTESQEALREIQNPEDDGNIERVRELNLIISTLEEQRDGRYLADDERQAFEDCMEKWVEKKDELENKKVELNKQTEDKALLKKEISDRRTEVNQAGENLSQARVAVSQAEAVQKAALTKTEGANQRVQKQSPGALSPISKVAQTRTRSFETNKTKPSAPSALSQTHKATSNTTAHKNK